MRNKVNDKRNESTLSVVTTTHPSERVREVKATRRFLWEKALKSGEKVLGCNRCQKYWACKQSDKDALPRLWLPACCSASAQPVITFYGTFSSIELPLYGNNLTATHSQAVALFVQHDCPLRSPCAARERAAGRIHPSVSFFSLDLPSSLSQHLAIILCLKTCHVPCHGHASLFSFLQMYPHVLIQGS